MVEAQKEAKAGVESVDETVIARGKKRLGLEAQALGVVPQRSELEKQMGDMAKLLAGHGQATNNFLTQLRMQGPRVLYSLLKNNGALVGMLHQSQDPRGKVQEVAKKIDRAFHETPGTLRLTEDEILLVLRELRNTPQMHEFLVKRLASLDAGNLAKVGAGLWQRGALSDETFLSSFLLEERNSIVNKLSHQSRRPVSDIEELFAEGKSFSAVVNEIFPAAQKEAGQRFLAENAPTIRVLEAEPTLMKEVDDAKSASEFLKSRSGKALVAKGFGRGMAKASAVGVAGAGLYLLYDKYGGWAVAGVAGAAGVTYAGYGIAKELSGVKSIADAASAGRELDFGRLNKRPAMLGALLILVAAGGGYYLYEKNWKPKAAGNIAGANQNQSQEAIAEGQRKKLERRDEMVHRLEAAKDVLDVNTLQKRHVDFLKKYPEVWAVINVKLAEKFQDAKPSDAKLSKDQKASVAINTVNDVMGEIENASSAKKPSSYLRQLDRYAISVVGYDQPLSKEDQKKVSIKLNPIPGEEPELREIRPKKEEAEDPFRATITRIVRDVRTTEAPPEVKAEEPKKKRRSKPAQPTMTE